MPRILYLRQYGSDGRMLENKLVIFLKNKNILYWKLILFELYLRIYQPRTNLCCGKSAFWGGFSVLSTWNKRPNRLKSILPSHKRLAKSFCWLLCIARAKLSQLEMNSKGHPKCKKFRQYCQIFFRNQYNIRVSLKDNISDLRQGLKSLPHHWIINTNTRLGVNFKCPKT